MAFSVRRRREPAGVYEKTGSEECKEGGERMFTRIQEKDLQGKGVVGQPSVPGLSVLEMQQSVEQIVREVAIPGMNRLAEELEEEGASQSLGARLPGQEVAGTVQQALDGLAASGRAHEERADNPHRVTAAQTGAYSRAETDAAIAQRVTEIGAGDMARAVYDPDGDGSVASADRFRQARKIGNAEFDGSRDVTLREIGALPADAYAAQEQETGQTWTDGRAVYRRVFRFNPNGQSGYNFDTGIPKNSVDTVWFGAESIACKRATAEQPDNAMYALNTIYSTVNSGDPSDDIITFLGRHVGENLAICVRGGNNTLQYDYTVVLYYTKSGE